jgi:hypothetical protein
MALILLDFGVFGDKMRNWICTVATDKIRTDAEVVLLFCFR